MILLSILRVCPFAGNEHQTSVPQVIWLKFFVKIRLVERSTLRGWEKQMRIQIIATLMTACVFASVTSAEAGGIQNVAGPVMRNSGTQTPPPVLGIWPPAPPMPVVKPAPIVPAAPKFRNR